MSSSLEKFRSELKSVCEKCGRDPKSVTLVAVSKKQPISKIHQAYREHQLDFGENYVQEALEKQMALQLPDIRWHMIGPIQTNKINKILGKFALIHSVDSLETATEINKRAQKLNLKIQILLQLNLAKEETKSGQSKSELLANWSQFKTLGNLQIEGLMTMPPLADDPEKTRPYFRELKDLSKQLQLKHLSMGTSGDWKVAVEEGATLIRIGTAVFGERGS
jgi:pyridoxal phosphate enzyme (YggS family)